MVVLGLIQELQYEGITASGDAVESYATLFPKIAVSYSILC